MVMMRDKAACRETEGRAMTAEESREFAALGKDIRDFQRETMTPAERAEDDALAARLQAGVDAFAKESDAIRASGGDAAVQHLAEGVLEDLIREAGLPDDFLDSIRRDPVKN